MIRRCLLVVLALLPLGCHRSDGSACAQYFDRYAACVAKMGPAARAAAEQNLRRERERMEALERDPGSRGQAAAVCRASLSAIDAACR